MLYALDDLTGARAAYERALAIFERVLPPGHLHISIVRKSLAWLEDSAKVGDAAANLYENLQKNTTSG